MSGGETAQPLADYYIQQWNEIGLDVKYTTGRLIDFQAFYDKLKNDDPEIDVYQGAWGTGSDPSPTGLYGPNSAFNYTRFESDENTKLLEAIDSKESFDEAKRKKHLMHGKNTLRMKHLLFLRFTVTKYYQYLIASKISHGHMMQITIHGQQFL